MYATDVTAAAVERVSREREAVGKPPLVYHSIREIEAAIVHFVELMDDERALKRNLTPAQNASAHAAAAAAAAQPSVPTFMDSIRSAGNAQREIQRQIASAMDAEVAE